ARERLEGSQVGVDGSRSDRDSRALSESLGSRPSETALPRTAGCGQPVPAAERGDRAGLDAEQRGQLLLRVLRPRWVEGRQRRDLAEHPGEVLLDGSRGNVRDKFEATAAKDFLDSGHGVGDVLGVVALGGQMLAVVLDVLIEGPASVFFPGRI